MESEMAVSVTAPSSRVSRRDADKPCVSLLPERMERLYSQAILIRAVEERLLELFSQGKLFGTVHTCLGQEWTGVSVAEYLQDGDLIFSNHRCHGHFIARTGDVEGLIAEIMGKRTGVCGGRGGSQHLCQRGFFSNGIQGGIVPVAAGLALAQKLKGTDQIAVVFIGDGTLGEGAVYETLNLMSKWELPLLIVLENNLYAQSTSQRQTLAGDICARAAAFGIDARSTTTAEPATLLEDVEASITLVRDERRPAFLRVDTYRLAAHSKGDDDRDPVEVQSYRARDPLTRFCEIHPTLAERAWSLAQTRIDAAVSAAEQAAFPELSSLDKSASAAKSVAWHPASVSEPDRVVILIRNALQRALQADARVILLGEDIESPYGGAFKATKGLSHEFPGRVRNTPISEALLVGLSNGLALAGMRPVCEIMFGDFLTLGADQIINHASKFRYMYNDQVSVPLILRSPMGGRRGYGPTHSQSLEKHFLGLPDTRMLAINHRHDPGELYDSLFATLDRPTLVIENKVLYGQRVISELPDGFAVEHSDEPFPTTRIRPEGNADVTVVCYGEMLREVEAAILRAFDEHEIICEVLCPTQLYPLNVQPIVSSVSSSHRLLVVEEGIGFAAFGAELIAQIQERSPESLRRVRRLSSPEHPIPACAPLEKLMLPHAESILGAIVELMSHG
jgi:2-oxoisovalerate dehydrogenase E1 component